MLINWFCFNCMQANPNKFQAIGVGKRTHERSPTFKFRYLEITSDEEVKLLGVNIGFKLSFVNHISNLCKKTAKQLNVLIERIGKNLSRLNKLSIFHTLFYPILTFVHLHGISAQMVTQKRWKKSKNELFDLLMKILAVLMKISYKKRVYQAYTFEE